MLNLCTYEMTNNVNVNLDESFLEITYYYWFIYCVAVKEAGKDITYVGFIVAGIVVLGKAFNDSVILI